MRAASWLVVAGVVLGGCFDEGTDTTRKAAAITTAQGLIAFGDIHSNIETDPGKAAEALLEFIKWPVAADTLVSPPFEGADMVMAARRTAPPAPNTPVPECLLQLGEPSCDTYTTTDTCEAGGFTFRGTMARRCAKCDDPRTVCTYGWVLPELAYTSELFTLALSTAGMWTGAASQVTPNLSARYTLKVPVRLESTDYNFYYGDIVACACTPFTIEDGPPPTGKPRKLVNSSFTVRSRSIGDGKTNDTGCAFVSFDGNGDVSIANKCECADGIVCSAPVPPIADTHVACGNSRCEANLGESYESCPTDCPVNTGVCGNNVCEIGESREDCPADCSGVAP